jgi:hypothetical protein
VCCRKSQRTEDHANTRCTLTLAGRAKTELLRFLILAADDANCENLKELCPFRIDSNVTSMGTRVITTNLINS